MPVGGLGVVRVFVAVWVTGLSERPRRRPRAVLGDPCRHGRAARRGHKRRQGPECRLPRSVRRPYTASQGTFVTGGELRRARAFEYASATPAPPLETIATHGNEEASSGGLKTPGARALHGGPVGKKPRNAAINPSNTIEIKAAEMPRGLSRPNAGCLRAHAGDADRLRVEAAAPRRDDGIRASLRLRAAGM